MPERPEEERALSLNECRRPSDLDRLDPRVYADLASRPATLLDLVRLRLEFSSTLDRLVKEIASALRRSSGRR